MPNSYIKLAGVLALILNRVDLETDHHSSRSMKTSLSAFEFCLRNSDPKKLVDNAVKLKKSQLMLTDILNNITKLNLDNYESIYVVGAGKAAAKMLIAFVWFPEEGLRYYHYHSTVSRFTKSRKLRTPC